MIDREAVSLYNTEKSRRAAVQGGIGMSFDDNNPEIPESDLVVLTDQDGNEVKFEFLDLIEFEGEEYVVLLPAEGGEEVVILRVEPVDDETESYVSVEDEVILRTVFMIFKNKFKDEFNFED